MGNKLLKHAKTQAGSAFRLPQRSNGDTPLLLLTTKAEPHAQHNLEALVPLAKALLKAAPADADTANKKGDTPLQIAAQWGHEGLVSVLVKSHGANPNLADKKGWTPLHFAASNGHVK